VSSGPTYARDSWEPRGVYAAIALSGFTALGAEVVWTRLLSLLFGATTYTFSMILTIFLAGLGAGSAAGAILVRRTADARALLGWAQIGLSFALAYGAWMTARGLPYWPIDTSLAPVAALDPRTDLIRTFAVTLPGALLWGISFPLAVSAAFPSPPSLEPWQRRDVTVGRVYAANTFGAVAGAVLTPLVFIPLVGTHGAQRILIVAASLSAALTMRPLWASSSAAPARKARRASGLAASAALVLLMAGAVVAAVTVPRVPAGLVAWGRLLPWHGEPSALYVGEGINASIAVTEESNGWRNFHVSGKVEASTEPQDMRLQRLLGHLTALMHEQGPKNVLVIGFGAGITAGALSIHPSIERMVICELEPLIPRVVSRYFADANYDVATDLKVRIVYDDARHYMLTARETFDVITSDPIHPWVKGAATLYTKEYFELVKQHLNPGGVVTQWVPLYESSPAVVKSEVATFFNVFPEGTVWSNDIQGRGYDLVLAGHATPQTIDIDSMQARLTRPEGARVAQSLSEVGLPSATSLLSTYGGRAHDLGPWLADAEINRDANLRLQYLAGMGLNMYQGGSIYDEMLKFRTFPESLFIGAPIERELLREQLRGPP